MDIGMIIGIVIIVGVVIVLGGGLAALFFMGTKPKHLTWKAKVYQLGDGVIKLKHKDNKNGYRLSELKPYTTDVIVKVDKKDGATHYWLKKLKKPTPVVTADCVEVWNQKEKEVKVLLQEDSCTLLKQGYDRKIGENIFRPMDHDRINMIKTELSERNARIEETKDILAAITPFITIGISIIGLVCITYFLAQGGIKQAEIQQNIAELNAQAQKETAQIFIQGINQKLIEENRPIKEEIPNNNNMPVEIPP